MLNFVSLYYEKQTVMDLTDTLTCLDLFELHLRLTHHYVAVGLTPERYHRSGCQGNLRGLHYCPLLLRLQHLNNDIECNSIITTIWRTFYCKGSTVKIDCKEGQCCIKYTSHIHSSCIFVFKYFLIYKYLFIIIIHL